PLAEDGRRADRRQGRAFQRWRSCLENRGVTKMPFPPPIIKRTMMFKSVFVAVAATLALSACQSTGSIDNAIQKNLPQVCSAAATAHSAFVVAASTGTIKPSVVA